MGGPGRMTRLCALIVASLLMSGASIASQAQPAHAAAGPRPMPPPAEVTIADSGFQPDVVAVAAGQSVVFKSTSAAEQSVTEATGLFDSGPIPPGGAFTVSVPVPGAYALQSNGNQATGTLTVGLLDLPGPATDNVNRTVPDMFGAATGPA